MPQKFPSPVTPVKTWILFSVVSEDLFGIYGKIYHMRSILHLWSWEVSLFTGLTMHTKQALLEKKI